MEDYVIRVENISKIYKLYSKPSLRIKEAFSLSKKCYHKEYNALKDVSFDVKKGEIVGIIGKNGAGKSTMLKIITNVLSPTSGKMKVDGKISALLELGAGFNTEYTGIENAYLNGQMIGFTREEMDDKIADIIEFADIGDFIYQPVKTYSSGMFARLAFSVAISVDPDILIVDEALSVGDVFFQNKCYKKFEDFRTRGKTILFVTHDMSSVIKYCDRCVLINGGTKIAEGLPSDVVDIYKKVMVGQWHEEETSKEGRALAEYEKAEWKSKLSINPNIQVYGNMKAEIVDFGVFSGKGELTNNIFKGDFYEIKVKVRINEIIDLPIFTYKLKDIKGNELTGTNTMLENVDTTFVKKGDIVQISFNQKQLLQPGQYLLSIGCTGYDGDEFVVYNRVYDACNILVIADHGTVGFFDSESTVTVECVDK